MLKISSLIFFDFVFFYIFVMAKHCSIDNIMSDKYNIFYSYWDVVLLTDVVAALIWQDDRFLACQRPPNKPRGLLWEFVGGKVEEGETLEDALVRECYEELAVKVLPGTIFMQVIHHYPDITIRLTLFNATIEEGTPKLLEHNDIRWITVTDIDKYSFCPADKDILVALKTINHEISPNFRKKAVE